MELNDVVRALIDKVIADNNVDVPKIVERRAARGGAVEWLVRAKTLEGLKDLIRAKYTAQRHAIRLRIRFEFVTASVDMETESFRPGYHYEPTPFFGVDGVPITSMPDLNWALRQLTFEEIERVCWHRPDSHAYVVGIARARFDFVDMR